MSTRYEHPHLKIEIILPLADGLISKEQTVQLHDLKDALDSLAASMKGKPNGKRAQ